MPRMSNIARAISMTRSDSWTTPLEVLKKDDYKQFCYERCPHPDNPCNGDCPEMKAFRKNNRRK